MGYLSLRCVLNRPDTGVYGLLRELSLRLRPLADAPIVERGQTVGKLTLQEQHLPVDGLPRLSCEVFLGLQPLLEVLDAPRILGLHLRPFPLRLVGYQLDGEVLQCAYLVLLRLETLGALLGGALRGLAGGSRPLLLGLPRRLSLPLHLLALRLELRVQAAGALYHLRLAVDVRGPRLRDAVGHGVGIVGRAPLLLN